MGNTPLFKVTVGGQTLSQSEGGASNVIVEDHIDMIGMAQITVPRTADMSAFTVGAEMVAEVGGGARKMFKGIITELRFALVNAVPTLTIVGMDPLCKMASSRVTKTYLDMTDSDIASEVIGKSGCTAGTVDATSGASKYVMQRNESNYFFLKRLAARNNYLLTANEGKIDFKSAQFSGSSVEIKQPDIQFLDFGFSTTNIPAQVTVIGWDYGGKAKVEGTATSGDIVTIGGGTNAVTKLGDVWQGTSYITDVMVSSQAAAKAMATAELNRLSRNFCRGRAIITGNPKLFAGALVKFSGMATGYNPEAVVISSRHTNDANGYLTEVHFTTNTYPS